MYGVSGCALNETGHCTDVAVVFPMAAREVVAVRSHNEDAASRSEIPDDHLPIMGGHVRESHNVRERIALVVFRAWIRARAPPKTAPRLVLH